MLVSKVRIESFRKEIFHIIARRKIHLQLICICIYIIYNNSCTTHVVTIKLERTAQSETSKLLQDFYKIVQSQTGCIHTWSNHVSRLW